jgi:CHAD domain-containing protein
MAKAKRIKGLDCGTSAAQGIALVLRAKLDEVCELRDAALDWSDIEGVHAMRVTSRRLRSALRDFAPYLSKEISTKRLRAVASALGAVRDEDVAILVMNKLAAEPSADVWPGIEQLVEERGERRDKARAALEKAIARDELAKLQEKFGAQLERATREPGKKTGAPVPFHDVGREVILARFRELQELSPSLYHPFDTEPLHRMRIAAKRLRYSIELHTQCWGEHLLPYAREVATLQDFLGELHDCDVWIEDLGARLGKLERRDRKRAVGGVPPPPHEYERRAAVWLLHHFVRERTRHFRHALALWDKWQATEFPGQLVAALDEVRGALESQPPAPHLAQAG